MQLDGEGRGFSFQRDEPLDMRMDRSAGETAADLVARAVRSASSPTRSSSTAKSASRAASRARSSTRATSEPIDTTGRLAAIVRRAVPMRGYQRIDPATRTFQALRIWVNRELDGLDTFLDGAC